jgi:malate dehydrogenase (oxaloacetate-decarboxylating)(NADP+)
MKDPGTFLGAGQAGVGIATLVVAAMTAEGLSLEEAKRRCWFVDVNGLVVKSRHDLREDQRPYAPDHAWMPDLIAAVQALKPTALIGVSGQPHTFTRPVIEAMSAVRDTPVIFALSNPTANAECNAEQVYGWSGGRAIFASGSPLPPVA